VRKAGWLILGLLAGCAQAPPRANPDAEDAIRASRELKTLELEFSAVTVSTTAPDCGRAKTLSQSICELTDRICNIAARHPEDATTDGLCKDARPRCEHAREQTQRRCGVVR